MFKAQMQNTATHAGILQCNTTGIDRMAVADVDCLGKGC